MAIDDGSRKKAEEAMDKREVPTWLSLTVADLDAFNVLHLPKIVAFSS